MNNINLILINLKLQIDYKDRVTNFVTIFNI